MCLSGDILGVVRVLVGDVRIFGFSVIVMAPLFGVYCSVRVRFFGYSVSKFHGWWIGEMVGYVFGFCSGAVW